MVAGSGDYRWSSYLCNALGVRDVLIAPHELYLQLAESPGQRCGAYRALLRTGLEGIDIAAIREATNKAWVLGEDRFRMEVEDLLMRKRCPNPGVGTGSPRYFTSGAKSKSIESDPNSWLKLRLVSQTHEIG